MPSKFFLILVTAWLLSSCQTKENWDKLHEEVKPVVIYEYAPCDYHSWDVEEIQGEEDVETE